MSNWTRFTVETRGSDKEIKRLLRDFRCAINDEAEDKTLILIFSNIFPDWDDKKDIPCLYFFHNSQGNELEFPLDAECRYCPPISFFTRLSVKYDIAFANSATSEHEWCEKWHIRNGKAKLLEAFSVDLRENDYHLFVFGGEIVNPAEDLPIWCRCTEFLYTEDSE